MSDETSVGKTSADKTSGDFGPSKSNALWGGRFSAGPSEIMERINSSIHFDVNLYAQDIAGSKAHCAMLVATGLLSGQDGAAIAGGLDRILEEINKGQFVQKPELEDIHMHIEARLGEIIGDAAGRLHTARSRNDQVATDFRLWVRDAIDHLDQGFQAILKALMEKAEPHAATVMPGLTHLQAAQPVTFGHHLMAYAAMFERDRDRLADCRRRLNECPLGSAALAGTPFPIDRDMTARELGFDRPSANSMDAVSDRDFAMEFLSAAAITGIHVSRLAEDIILWASDRFQFITLSDAFSTGSSIMPQKRNPDAAELCRGKSGRLIGALNALMVTLKGLPMTYCKDMQEDKEQVFDAADTLDLCLSAMTGMISDMTVNETVMHQAAGAGFSTATDLADWLVRVVGMPFRQAHEVTGRIVARADQLNSSLEDLELAVMQEIEPRIDESVFQVLGPENSVASRDVFGGTAPQRVREAITAARRRLTAEESL